MSEGQNQSYYMLDKLLSESQQAMATREAELRAELAQILRGGQETVAALECRHAAELAEIEAGGELLRLQADQTWRAQLEAERAVHEARHTSHTTFLRRTPMSSNLPK